MTDRDPPFRPFTTAASALWPRMAWLWRSGSAIGTSRSQRESGVLDHSPDTVARYDGEGRGVYANAALLRTWSITNSQYRGCTAAEVPGGAAGALLHARIEEALATGRDDEFEYQLENAANGFNWTHVRLVPERDSSGAVTGVLAIGRDITVLKEAAQTLEASRERLRRLAAHRDSEQERERKRLAHRMHEDLAQILAVLGWELKGVRQEMDADDPCRPRVEFMSTLAERALRSVLSTVDSIRPATLGLGIVPALERLVRRFQEAHGIPCALRTRGPEPHLDEERATIVYRMAEALLGTTAERPGTEQVELSLAKVRGNCLLRMHDRNPTHAPDSGSESIGLIIVQEFALRLGGEAVVLDQAGGRLVEVTIPAQGGQARESDGSREG